MHCFLRLSDLSLFPLSSLSASKAEWPTEEEEKEEKEEGEPKRRRREFHARCSRCRRYRRYRHAAAAAGARNLRCRTRTTRGWQRNASNPLFSFGVRARQQGWVKITEEGDSQTLWTVSLSLSIELDLGQEIHSRAGIFIYSGAPAGKITIIQSHSSHPFFLQ